MALLTEHSTVNRVIDTALAVNYSKAVVTGTWSKVYAWGLGSETWTRMYEMHRYARKSYRYVGMTYAAAQACEAAMIAYYTREALVPQVWDSWNGMWINDTSGAHPKICTAEVSVEHQEDGAWDVIIHVNEDDVRMAMPTYSGDAKNQFPTSVTSRKYDGGPGTDTEETED